MMRQNAQYDYLIVGAGLFGAVFAQQAKKAGKKVLVIDKRPNIAGNIYTEQVEGIHVHKYGAHIFHTNNRKVWEYVNHFATFNRFTNSLRSCFITQQLNSNKHTTAYYRSTN